MIKKMHRWPSDGTLHPVGKKHRKHKKKGYKIAKNNYKVGK